jgi:PII-like signaling protein
MEITGQGLRVRVHFGERDHAPGQLRGRPLRSALLEYLRREGAAGATVTRSVAGYGAHSRIHTASLVDLSSDLPLVLEWVDTQERVEQLLPGLSAILEGSGRLVTTDPVEIRRYEARRGRE